MIQSSKYIQNTIRKEIKIELINNLKATDICLQRGMEKQTPYNKARSYFYNDEHGI